MPAGLHSPANAWLQDAFPPIPRPLVSADTVCPCLCFLHPTTTSNHRHYVALQDDAGAAAAGAAAGAGAEEALYQPSRRSPLPGGAGRPSTRATRVSDNNYEEEDDRPVGPKFQVTSIPAWRPRPAKPTAAEAKFLPAAPLYEPTAVVPAVAATPTTNSKTRAGRAGVTVPMPPVGVAASSSDFRYKYRWAKDSAGRRKLLHAAVNALDKQLGPEMVKVREVQGRLGCLSCWIVFW